MKKIALILVLIFGLCGSLYAQETVSSDIQILFLKQRIQILEQQIKIRDLQQEAMERTPSELDIAAEVGASANSYDVNTTPSATADYLLGIDDFGEGSWAVQRFNIQNLLNLSREFSSQAFTAGETQATVTEAIMRASKWITNQGGSAETDLILDAPASEFPFSIVLVDEEGTGFEVCPPSGEQFDLNDGETLLTVNYCVESPALKGCSAVFSRGLDESGAGIYRINTVRCAWVDGGDTGD